MSTDLAIYGAIVATVILVVFVGLISALIHATKPARVPLFRDMVRSHRWQPKHRMGAWS